MNNNILFLLILLLFVLFINLLSTFYFRKKSIIYLNAYTLKKVLYLIRILILK